MSATILDTRPICECGNRLDPLDDGPKCEWCNAEDYARETQTVRHFWTTSRFSGAVTCKVCGLLPLDDTDTFSDCPGEGD